MIKTVNDPDFKPVITIDHSIKDIGNDPAVKAKAERAEAFLKKHGVPDSMSKKSK